LNSTDERRRYCAEQDKSGIWWGVFDNWTERFIDHRRWLSRFHPGVEASRLNHKVPAPEAGSMSTSDGLGR